MTIKADSLLPYKGTEFIYVETGTHLGWSLNLAVEAGARLAMSCDTDQGMVSHSKSRFATQGDLVRITCCSSAKFLARALVGLPPLVLVVMLDAHDDQHGPLLDELKAIIASSVVPDVLLIDDWRYIRTSYWGYGETETMDLIRCIYGNAATYTWKDGEGDWVDTLNGPPVADVLEVKKVRS